MLRFVSHVFEVSNLIGNRGCKFQNVTVTNKIDIFKKKLFCFGRWSFVNIQVTKHGNFKPQFIMTLNFGKLELLRSKRALVTTRKEIYLYVNFIYFEWLGFTILKTIPILPHFHFFSTFRNLLFEKMLMFKKRES